MDKARYVDLPRWMRVALEPLAAALDNLRAKAVSPPWSARRHEESGGWIVRPRGLSQEEWRKRLASGEVESVTLPVAESKAEGQAQLQEWLRRLRAAIEQVEGLCAISAANPYATGDAAQLARVQFMGSVQFNSHLPGWHRTPHPNEAAESEDWDQQEARRIGWRAVALRFAAEVQRRLDDVVTTARDVSQEELPEVSLDADGVARIVLPGGKVIEKRLPNKRARLLRCLLDHGEARSVAWNGYDDDEFKRDGAVKHLRADLPEVRHLIVSKTRQDDGFSSWEWRGWPGGTRNHSN